MRSVMSLSAGAVACITYGLLAFVVALIGVQNGRPLALLAIAFVPIAWLVRRRPEAFALALIAGGVILRLDFFGLQNADQLAVSQAALQQVLNGSNPYGHGFDVSAPPGAPFPYGPLALVAFAPGVWIELVAAVATMGVMALQRCWTATAIYAAAPLTATMTMSGTNDVLPGFLILLGLLWLRTRPRAGAAALALAAAVKPYAFAWFPGAIAIGGAGAAIALAAVTAIFWSPLLVWGPGSFLTSLQLAHDVHPVPEGALNMPELRALAVVPFVAGFLARSWLAAVLLGTAVFVLVLFLDRWASVSYWLAVAPILLVAGEETVRAMIGRRRRMAGAPA